MKPTDKYKAIEFWGKRLGSLNWYIEQEKQRALEDNAPDDAIYKAHEGHWRTLRDVTNPDVIREAVRLGLMAPPVEAKKLA